MIQERQQHGIRSQTNLDYDNNNNNNNKTGTTENFVLNQFTSDQANDQMIELTDIFGPLDEMMFANHEHIPLNDVQISYQLDNRTSNEILAATQMPYSNTTNAATTYSSFPANYQQQNIIPQSLADLQPVMPCQSIHDLNMTQNSPIDNANASYLAILAASAPAGLGSLPNATLYNKMLATLPKETLASAERLLSPRPKSQQPSQGQFDFVPESSSKKTPAHYYGTFKVDSTPPRKSSPKSGSTLSNNTTNNSSNTSYPATAVSGENNTPICSNCGARSTPLWRRSVNDEILCNACGLYLKLHNVPRPKHMKTTHRSTNDDISRDDKSIACSNCGTNKTPLWRRDSAGSPLCNACGLYLKLHNEKRPLSMKTDVIKKRQRTESLIANNNEEQSVKRPRYYDQQTLMPTGYSDTALPGTGILLMSASDHSSKH
ncbi:hypothetical protein CU097_010332 [Rhizopus azygosporus]|uniref:GATA-type domain-containing protein n=1 Tax=Rhizopus azygosporus TaxID=86630 RepID=A0A367K2J4_RHIAZ|nr:hypothetical protein CU097_010332 [Rhizopus azygosporus]